MRASTWRITRNLASACLVALLVALALAAGRASAAAPTLSKQPLPNWLTGNVPEKDPLQASLEAKIRGFRTSGLGTATDNGCSDALHAWSQAENEDRSLQLAYSSMQDSFNALTTGELAQRKLIASRAALLTLSIALFVDALPGVLGELATVNTGLTAAISSNLIAIAYEIGNVRSALFSGGSPDAISSALNTLKAGKADLGAFATSPAGKALSGPVASGILTLLGYVKTSYDMEQDVSQAIRDSAGATASYFAAARHYDMLLGRLQQSVTRMNTSMKDCSKKTAPAKQAQPPLSLQDKQLYDDLLSQLSCGLAGSLCPLDQLARALPANICPPYDPFKTLPPACDIRETCPYVIKAYNKEWHRVDPMTARSFAELKQYVVELNEAFQQCIGHYVLNLREATALGVPKENDGTQEQATAGVAATISLKGTPSTGKAPLKVVFQIGINLPRSVQSWQLVFGDGSASQGTGKPPQSVSHTYEKAYPLAFQAALLLKESPQSKRGTAVDFQTVYNITVR